jgi:ceramide glucosyltransferase
VHLRRSCTDLALILMPIWQQLLLIYLPVVIAMGSLCYFLGVIVASFRFKAEREPVAEFTPPVSVLKPCAGTEPHFYETLRSHFLQDYPDFEILFCVRDESDSAVWTIRMLQHEFPAVASRILFVADIADANPKMVKLREMVEQARHEVLVISDADISVEPDYLRGVVAPLKDERVGMVTCLYRGVPARGLNSLLEALSMSGDFVGQVLLGRMLAGMRFGLGATMATRKAQLRAIGGLTPWLDYLADDFILGNKIAATGLKVHLSKVMVTTHLPKRSWEASFQQQLRWARTIRACSPGGYPGLIFAYGLPLALVPLLAGTAGAWQLGLLATVIVARFLAAWASGRGVARDPLIQKYSWLLPLRDLWALIIWAVSFLGDKIVWRSRRYRLDAGGKLSRPPA